MIFRIAADAVLTLHFLFILFVLFGSLLALKARRVAWIHLPAAVWGAYVELAARVCPLTFLENSLRQSAGGSGYTDSFVEHYLLPVVYPAGLTRSVQFWLAGGVILVNVVIYGCLLYRWTHLRTLEPGD